MLATLMPYLAVAVLLAVGFSLNKWRDVSGGPLLPLLTYVFVPVYLFHALLGGVGQKHILWILGLGAALAFVSIVVVRLLQERLHLSIGSSAAMGNILLFSLPVLTIGWNIKANPRMALAVLFIGMALTHLLIRERGYAARMLLRQPWVYGVVLAMLVSFGLIPRAILLRVTHPIASATPVIALLYLGTTLTALGGWVRRDVWGTVAVRVVVGFAVAFVFMKLGSIPVPLRTVLLAGAIAPPASLAASMVASDGFESQTGVGGDGPVAAVGLLVTLVLYIFFNSVLDLVV